MGYIMLSLKNMRSLIRRNMMMNGLLIVSQIISVIVILMAYGMILNSKREENEVNKYERILSVGDPDVTFREAEDVFNELFYEYDDKIESITASGYDEENDITVWFHFTYKNGSIIPDEEWIKSTVPNEGRMYSNEEFYNGEKVVVTNKGCGEMETCMIAGEEYKVIGQIIDGGYAGLGRVVEMPYLSANENLIIDGLSIILRTLPTVSEYNLFATKMFDSFGYECNVSLPEKFSNNTKDMYQTYIIIAVVMLVMSVINIGIVYGYILKIRTKNNAIMSLCGGKKRTIVVINLIEIVAICICSYIAALLIFVFIIMPNLKDIFIYFTDIFKDYVFMDLLGIYLATIILTGWYNIIRVLKKQTVNILKGGNE